MIVGARRTGLSTSITANVLGFSLFIREVNGEQDKTFVADHVLCAESYFKPTEYLRDELRTEI